MLLEFMQQLDTEEVEHAHVHYLNVRMYSERIIGAQFWYSHIYKNHIYEIMESYKELPIVGY